MRVRIACYKEPPGPNTGTATSFIRFWGPLMTACVPHIDEADDLNPADYVDALLRPQSPRFIVAQEKIKGRRLRDKYLEEVTVTKLVEIPAEPPSRG